MEASVSREAANDFDALVRELRRDHATRYRDGNPPSLADLKAPRDVRKEHRAGTIRSGAREAKGVALTWTPCTFGGSRPWFICPACKYRVAILFGDGCRRCKGIRYQSQYDARLDRLRVRSSAIRQQLGHYLKLFDLIAPRPKRMRRATYQRLLTELETVELEAIKLAAPEYPAMSKDLKALFDRARRYEAMRDKYGW